MRIIAGEARGRRIEAPSGKNTRPTLDRVRENLFNMLQGEINGTRVLDLFAGSGALSFEALSRGAESAFLADHNRQAINAERMNAESLGYEKKVRIVQADWRQALKELAASGESFDIVFLDPPYSMTNLKDVFDGLIPVLAPDALIILEHEAGKIPDVGTGFKSLKQRNWGFCGVIIYQRRDRLQESE